MFLDLPIIPEVDVAFAISANAVQSQANFQKMKDVISQIVEMYGQERVFYSVITYGSVPDVKIQFNDQRTDDQLITYIKSFSRASGSALAPTLEKVKEIFNQYARPGVRKVLVLITDKKSDSDENVLREKASLLEQAKIKVIPVGLGGETDNTELQILTPRKVDVITKPNTISTKYLASVIMRKLLEGTFFNLFCIFDFVIFEYY